MSKPPSAGHPMTATVIKTVSKERQCALPLAKWSILRLSRLCYLFKTNFKTYINVICFLLGNSLASEFYMPTFRNTLFHLHRRVDISTRLWRWNRQSVLKRWHIKFRHQAITQKKAYNIQNTVKVWIQEHISIMDKTPTHALFTQHYISLACWFH